MVLVCVTDQESCNRLIIAGRRLADTKNTLLKTVCVRPRKAVDWLASEEVEYLYALSKQLDAEMVVLFHDTPVAAVSEFIRKHDTDAIIAGTPPDNEQSVFLSGLASQFPCIPILTADASGQLTHQYKVRDTCKNAKPPVDHPDHTGLSSAATSATAK